MRRWLQAVAVVLFPLVALAQFTGGNAPGLRAAQSSELAFEANRGQSDSDVRFLARGSDYSIFVTSDEVVFTLQDRGRGDAETRVPVMRLQFAGSTGARRVEGVDPLPGVSNYYRGADPRGWQRDVPRYAKVRLVDVYPGIDFVCYGNGGQLEYDVVVQPGADASLVRLRSVGTRNLRVDPTTGDLLADAERGTVRHQALVAHEASAAAKNAIAASFRVDEKQEIRFDVPKRDLQKTLTIDPTIIWSTLHGGNDEDAGMGIVADNTGSPYVTGYTSSTDFPTQTPAQGSNASNYTTDYFDIFVSKFSADGQTLLYSTYFGGERDDYGIAIAIDSTNAAYVTGRTRSSLTFPTTAPTPNTAYQAANGGGNYDAFVFKLSPTGQLVYSTFVGGSLEDGGEGIAVDTAGNAYVNGYTWSIGAATTLFPRTVTLGPGGGVQDGFSLKLNPTGSGLVYSAIVGGAADETLEAIDIDATGNAYIIGRTQSNDFPTVLPIQGTRKGGYDVTMSRINAAGTAFDYSTYLGGDANDYGVAIEVDAAGNAYGSGHVFEWTNRTVSSATNPLAFPTTTGVVQRINNGNWDVFISKLNPAGQFIYSTMVGAPTATSEDQSYGIGVDAKGNATFAGNTNVVGTRDVFLAKMNSNATVQLYGQLIQGSSGDFGRDLDFDQRGYAYITGYTQSANFGAPLVNPRQSTHVGGSSGFVVVLTDSVNLGITKTDGQATDTPGTSITYTITASNSGPTAATGVTVFDDFDDTRLSGISWTASTSTGVTGFDPSGTGDINDTGISFPVNSSVTYTVNATILNGATGTLSNTATVTESGDVIDVDTANNSATDTTTLTPSADLSITKTDGVTTATPGGSVTYTITASNGGPNPVTGATVADTFPASLTCNWTCVGFGGGTCTAAGAGNLNDTVNLPNGGGVTYTASCTVSPAASGSLSNTATVTAPGGITDPPGNNSATDNDTLTPQADLAITKTDGVTTATAGGSVTYTITSSNSGPSNVSGATVADTFPASLTCTWTCFGAGGGTCTGSGSGNINDSVNLPSGGSVTYTASCNISPSATGTLSNNATVTAPGGVTDSNSGNNSATDSDTLNAEADLSITKTDGVTTATAGGSVTYTITSSNSGPSHAAGATVADTFPASLTCTWTCAGFGGGTCTAAGSGNINDTVNLPSGGGVTYTASCTVSPSATGTISNTATVTAPGGVTDSSSGNNSATDSDTLDQQADLSITKTDGVTTATAGGSVTYTITSSNSGPSNATGATIADTFPASLTCTWSCLGAGGGTCTASGAGNINDTVNLPSGGSVTYTASCTVSPSATGTLSNTATVTAPGGVTDSSSGNNSATDNDTMGQQADLAITKTDGVTTATAGGSVTYTITSSNSGPSNITGATIADTLPASLTCTWTCAGIAGGTCTAAGSGNINDAVNLPSGASVTYTARCTVSPSATGTISNTATVTAPGSVTETNQGNNSATDEDTVAQESDLSITKTDGLTTAAPGGPVTYTIVVSNSGPSSVTGANVTDTFPADLTGVTYTASSANGATGFTAAGSGNINDTVNLPAGSSITYIATGTLSPSATADLVNTATVIAPNGVTDPTPGNNSATDTDTVSPAADLSVTKTDAPDPVTAGGQIVYTIGIANNGPADAATVALTDILPAGTTFASLTQDSGPTFACITPAVNANGTVTCSIATLATAASASFTLTVNVTTAGTTITNTATATSATADDIPANNSATTTTTVLGGADVFGTKSVTSSGQPVSGSMVEYTVILTNNGAATQQDNAGNEFTDVLPAGLTLQSATASSGTASTAGNTVTWNGSLASGASVTITILATVSAPPGTTISNQGTISYDSNGDSINDATRMTDDSSVAGSSDPTLFVVAATTADVPLASPMVLLLLSAMLAITGVVVMRRA
ncbi:MAG TPA: SBBP repeat-containing protein [Thermoanaerobaculia bacterium]|nr:SBBP repeat-containing protein [Thermoanaerobaculia bacterium]